MVRRAVSGDEISVAYQPLVDLATGRVLFVATVGEEGQSLGAEEAAGWLASELGQHLQVTFQRGLATCHLVGQGGRAAVGAGRAAGAAPVRRASARRRGPSAERHRAGDRRAADAGAPGEDADHQQGGAAPIGRAYRGGAAAGRAFALQCMHAVAERGGQRAAAERRRRQRAAALGAGVFAPYDPNALDLVAMLAPVALAQRVLLAAMM